MAISNDQATQLINQANILYFQSRVYEHTKWMGVHIAKCPMDLWTYQEIMFETKTNLVIETGTLFGGSALFFAHMLDMMGTGQVISIDIEKRDNLPEHPRITYLNGSSVSRSILAEVRELAANATSTMVVLDSDHKAGYKYDELRAYREFVTPENYMIAEDSAFDFYPAWPEYGPGPASAVKDFLAKDTNFEADRSREQHMLTFAPYAFLKKKA